MRTLSAILGALGLLFLLLSATLTPRALGEAAGAATATAQLAGDAARGKALFLAKGCATCHLNSRAGDATGMIPIGPNLSNYSNDPTFLARWLADPRAVKPATGMPNLNLSSTEIADLIAFLNSRP